MDRGTVIGCVWGAHRALVDTLARAARIQQRPVPAPDYEWCEQQWARLRKTAPGPAVLPQWLEMELWAAWRRETAERATEPRQLELWETA